MKYSKIEMFGKIKEILANAGCEKDYLDFCDKEVEIIKNKYEGAKLKKQVKADKKYSELKPKFLEFFTNAKDHTLGNADITIEGLSVSAKTSVINRLIEEKLVERCPKAKAKDRVTYRLITE